jgi:hypothetical protein
LLWLYTTITREAMSHALTLVWNALPLILSGGFILLMLVGFWRGMSIKPRPSHERAPERFWGWTGW